MPVSTRMVKRMLILLFSLFVVYGSAEAITHTETFFSSTLDREVDYQVIIPGDYTAQTALGKRYPVIYLLHCAGCTKNNETFWGTADRDSIVDALDVIVAAPNDGSGDGRYTFSWWLDSPVMEGYRFSTFVGEEFKKRIDSLYATLPDKQHTGIAGHSMGGYGALHNALEFPDTYGCAFAAQGLLSLLDHDTEYGLPRLLGSITDNRDNWIAADIISQSPRFQNTAMHLRFYSGPYGWFEEDNRKLDSALNALAIDHVYFTNDDYHTVTFAQLTAAMNWFDSLFTRNTHTVHAIDFRHAPAKAGTISLLQSETDATRCFNLLGKAWAPGIIPMPGRKLIVIRYVDGTAWRVANGMDGY